MLFFSSSTITPKRTKAVPCRRFPYRYLWTATTVSVPTSPSHAHHRPLILLPCSPVPPALPRVLITLSLSLHMPMSSCPPVLHLQHHHPVSSSRPGPIAPFPHSPTTLKPVTSLP